MSRCIDADPLCEEMKKRQDSAHKWYVEAHAKADEETMVYADSAMAAFIECRLTIENQPTADVAPVVHGKWLHKAWTYKGGDIGVFICSNCGQAITHMEYKYCPNCGAKMDGAEDGQTG